MSVKSWFLGFILYKNSKSWSLDFIKIGDQTRDEVCLTLDELRSGLFPLSGSQPESDPGDQAREKSHLLLEALK